MPNSQIDTLALAAVFVAASACAGTAFAQQAAAVDTSAWECESCPFEDGASDAALELGAGYVDDAAAKFGDYTGLDEDGAFAVASGEASGRRENGWRWSMAGEDLGLDARSLALRAEQPGRLDLSLTYDKLPHTIFDTTATPYRRTSDRALALPAGFVRAGVTQQMSTLDAALRPIDIETQRETVGAGAEFLLNRRWSTFARFRREERDGVRRQGAAFAFSAVETPLPLDYTTDALTLGLNYGGERVTARLAYDGSLFDNRIPDVTFANPYLGPSEGRIAGAPDNSAHHLDASVNWRWGERTTLSAAAVLAQLRQDEDFLPFTINSALPTDAPPRASLDGKVDATHMNLALSTDMGGVWSALEGLGVRADVRYDERDNDTPQSAYAYVVTDVLNASPQTNLPYDVERTRYRVNGVWDMRRVLRFLPTGQRLQLSGEWRREQVERNLQEVAESTEDQAWGGLKYRPARWLELRMKLGAANRDVDAYAAPAAAVGGPQNPLMRKYNMADRERDFAQAQLSWTPVETLSFTASGEYASNDYVDSPLGLERSRDASANVEASWTPGESASFSAFYGWSESDASQRGSQSFGAPDWTAQTEDVSRTGGASVRLPHLGPRLTVNVDWFFADTRGDVATVAIGGFSLLPSLRTRMDGGQIAAVYRWTQALSLQAAMRYERLDADDWALDMVEPTTVPTLLSMGADAYRYDVTMFTLSFRYHFGGAQADSAAGRKAED